MNQLKTSAANERNLNNVIKIDSPQIKSHLGELVRFRRDQSGLKETK